MPKIVFKPVFIAWTTILAQLPIQLFLSFWAAGFIGGMLNAVFDSNDKSLTSNLNLTVGIVALILIPLALVLSKKYNYLKTEYRFFDDRLEFEEGFLTINKKIIRYGDIKEISLRRGVLQRINNLGTIYLATVATGTNTAINPFSSFGLGGTSASGIAVRDLLDPETQYEKIRLLVDARRGG